MQKLAAISKMSDNDTRTVFVSHMSDSFSKKFTLNWNTLIVVYIQIHTQ